MGKVWAIAFNTFKEAVRNRILYILLIFAIVLLLFSGVVQDLTVSAQGRVIRSLGLGCINIFGLLIAVFVGIGLVYNELDKKTIYTIISKPIDRWQFILGKYFGLLLTIYINVIIMSLFFYFSLYWQSYTSDEVMAKIYASQPPGETFGPVQHAAYLGWSALRSLAFALKTLFFLTDPVTRYLPIVNLMTCLELAIVTAFVILYSSFSTPTLSALLTIFTFVIGRCNEDIVRYTMYLQRKGLTTSAAYVKYHLAQFIAHVAPNLKIYYSDTSYRALSDLPVSLDPFVVAYAIVYPALFLTLAVLIFRRRNFK